jgi:hypothetical protein
MGYEAEEKIQIAVTESEGQYFTHFRKKLESLFLIEGPYEVSKSCGGKYSDE